MTREWERWVENNTNNSNTCLRRELITIDMIGDDGVAKKQCNTKYFGTDVVKDRILAYSSKR